MPGRTIDRIRVKGFRGVKQLTPLVLGGKSLVLFGENGTGKSAFVEALERVLTGRVSTLEGVQGLSFQRHGPHIRVGPDDWLIELELTGTPPATAVAPGGSLADSPADYYLPARQQVYILRRSQVLRFLDAQPSERYEMLGPFLPLANLSAIEAAASEAHRALVAETKGKQKVVADAEAVLRSICSVTDRSKSPDAATVLSSVNQKLEGIGALSVDDLDHLAPAAEALATRIGSLSGGDQMALAVQAASAIGEAADSVTRIDPNALSSARLTLAKAEADLSGHFYAAVLVDGARWIEDDRLSQCPLCEQEMAAISPAAVVARARLRLDQHAGLLAARAAVDVELSSLTTAVQRALASAKRASSAFRQYQPNNESLAAVWKWAEAELNPGQATADLDRIVGSVDRDPDSGWVASLRSAGDEISASTPAKDRAAEVTSLIEARDLTVKAAEAWAGLERASLELDHARKLEARGSAYIGALQASRKKVLVEILGEVSKEIDDIYDFLHDEPDTGQTGPRKVRLELRDAFSGSINMKGDFYEKADEDPRAFYSEAHLDTLGIAVFLALRHWYRRRNPGFNLLVLDDIVTSVDAAHAARLADYLIEESKDYQLILTTHDRILFEHIKDLQGRHGAAARFVNREIVSWDLESGPGLHEPQDQITTLREQLSGPDGPAIASAAGRVLEGILREMRFRLDLSVPAKRDERYEIGDIWPAFLATAKKGFPGLYASGATTFDALDVRWPLRNWIGAHFNAWAKRIPLSEARRFGLAVSELFDLVYCSDCREFLSQSRVPRKQLACRGGHRVLGEGAPNGQVDRPAVAQAVRGVLRGAHLAPVVFLDVTRDRGAD
jgi:energy-coupling factor transporter ATP-binding protein EcfA2